MHVKLLLVHCSVAAVVAATCLAAQPSPACYDEDGNPVDWYIAYKFPDLFDQPRPLSTGYAYAYITSNSVQSRVKNEREKADNDRLSIASWLEKFISHGRSSQTVDRESEKRIASNDDKDFHWTISSKLITDPESVVMRTLDIAYNMKNGEPGKINSVYYNDAPNAKSGPNVKKSGSRAHAKGLIIMDDITGDSVWLTHSTPLFPPPRTERLEFNENSRKFGQTFMCIRYDLRKTGKQIVNHLVNMFPLVYDFHVSDRLFSLIPELKELSIGHSRRNKRRAHERNTNKDDETSKLAQRIRTKGGQELLIYSKSANFGEDLYSNWMDQELKTTLFVETWRNGAGTPLNSTCPKDSYKVNNVQDLRVTYGATKVTWSYHQDHSKWAISETKNPGFVCISDINRMQSQFKRGGGAVCIRCPSCWSVFSNTILDLEPCPAAKPRLAQN